MVSGRCEPGAGHSLYLSLIHISGVVYMAIWDWGEGELDLDVRFPAPQTEDTLDCTLLEGELASKLLAALREQDLPELAAEIAPDWDCLLYTSAGSRNTGAPIVVTIAPIWVMWEPENCGHWVCWRRCLSLIHI